IAVPGSAIPPSKEKLTLDIRGMILDERGRGAGAPLGTIKDTLTVPPATPEELANRQIQYQTGMSLPAGRYTVKVVVRENSTGQMGSFETPIVVPELAQAPVK